MLDQNILQVYLAESGDVVIAVGRYKDLSSSVDVNHITLEVSELRQVANALNELAKELD